MAHLSAHRPHQDVVTVQFVDYLARHAEASNVDARSSLDDGADVSRDGIGGGGEQVDTERLRCRGTHLCHLFHEQFGAHRCSAEGADASCFRDGDDQVAVRHTTHSGEHDGQFDSEHFGETRLHACHRIPRGDGGREPGPPSSVPVGARTGEEVPVPAARSERGRAHLVFEHPTCEAATGPVARIDDPQCRVSDASVCESRSDQA